MFKCTRCDRKPFESEDSLRKHSSRKHKVSSKDFYVEFKLGGMVPTCGCGCGTTTRYNNWSIGFSVYVPGHQSRVQNPMQGRRHTEEARRRISEANTGKASWCQGLSKGSDPRIMIAAKKGSQTIMANDELRKQRSETMRKHRFDGTIPTLRGVDHSQWRGGTSHIRELTRARKPYCAWHLKIRERSDHTCIDCGIHEKKVSNSTLDVHHDGELYADIVNRFTAMMNPKMIDDFDLRSRIADAIAAYHLDADVSGIALCRDCHRKLHANLNFQDDDL